VGTPHRRLLTKKENSDPYDQSAFDTAMRDAVSRVVAQRVDVGIDVVSDGEMTERIAQTAM